MLSDCTNVTQTVIHSQEFKLNLRNSYCYYYFIAITF